MFFFYSIQIDLLRKLKTDSIEFSMAKLSLQYTTTNTTLVNSYHFLDYEGELFNVKYKSRDRCSPNSSQLQLPNPVAYKFNWPIKK